MPVVLVLGVDVCPPQETRPAARTMVRVITKKPRANTAALNFWRLPRVNIVSIMQRAASTIVHADAMRNPEPNPGTPYGEGGEVRNEAVGVDVSVSVSVV